MKNPILAMCQVGTQVLLALKHGTLVAVSTSSFQIEYQIMEHELARDGLVQMLTLNDHAEQIAMAYKDGSVALISCCLKCGEDDAKIQIFDDNVLSVVKAKRRDIKLSILKVASSQLYAIEVCKPQSSNQVQLWCGCDKSFIEVFTPHDGSSQAQFKITVLNTHISSADIPQDAGIIQLTSSFNAAAHMMYALHSCDNVISCWSVREQPVLNNVIKLTQLSSPGS